MLRDHEWQFKYTPVDGDLVELFYVPALTDAKRYDRLTGYFNAQALALAARGIEHLVRNSGHMRLVVGCTLDAAEVEAIERGEALKVCVERKLSASPLDSSNGEALDALELLSWMVARGYLEVKVAVPCDSDGEPVENGAIFHEKSGVIQDSAGDRIAWTGSLNETAGGWRSNWETLNVFRGWIEGERVSAEEGNFARIWSGQGIASRLQVLDVPTAVRRDLLRFLPADDRLPKRLADRDVESENEKPDASEIDPPADRCREAWTFIRSAPSAPDGGERVGEATSVVTPWPHQVRAFQRLHERWPPRLLIADEVGLGKTIQAGLLIRQSWLAGTAKRVLILAPKAVLTQWQIELREKFNLNWPIYDGSRLIWQRTQVNTPEAEQLISRDGWHKQDCVIVSSQLVRRADRARELLDSEPWDLVVLDEAHHARRRAAATTGEDRPNALLDLMRQLADRAEGLLLLTATPMQVNPVEVWDLLNLLGLPKAWSVGQFLKFFEDLGHPCPSNDALARAAGLFGVAEDTFGAVAQADVQRIAGISKLKAGKMLRAIRDRETSLPIRMLDADERTAAVAVMRAWSPIRHLVSRHTREVLRGYIKSGALGASIAERDVQDDFVEMSAVEASLYDAVDDYISSTYNKAEAHVRNAVGFVMTVYRRRLASSFHALGQTLRKRLKALSDGETELFGNDEDVSDDEALESVQDVEEVAENERKALVVEERADIERLLRIVESMPPDSKFERLLETLEAVRADGYAQVMVFTQYADTMDFLRERLVPVGDWRLMCYSGRGGEVPEMGGDWRGISREEAKRRFREAEADILLCTDAAAEGLNFQFCGALVNYDMPWNPMRVEQRIGRIDRLGQEYPRVRIINLHYEGTVETDVYRALRSRIRLFETVVGPLQPILASLPGEISGAVLKGRREGLGDTVAAKASSDASPVFDIDASVDAELRIPERPESPLTMEFLDEVLSTPELMPPGVEVRPLGEREFAVRSPGMASEVRVTTDRAYYEEHAESLEFWSPGGELFERVRGLID